MTKNPQKRRQQQLFQAISEYLQNAGLIQSALETGRPSSVRKLELTVRSLNLQRQP